MQDQPTNGAVDPLDPLAAVLAGVEEGLHRLPADDPYVEPLTTIRRGLLLHFALDEFAALNPFAPEPASLDQLENIPTISRQAVAARRRKHRKQDES